MQVSEVINALVGILGKMSNPTLEVKEVRDGKIIFVNGVEYDLSTCERCK